MKSTYLGFAEITGASGRTTRTRRVPLVASAEWDAGGAVGEVVKARLLTVECAPAGEAEIWQRGKLALVTVEEAQRAAQDIWGI